MIDDGTDAPLPVWKRTQRLPAAPHTIYRTLREARRQYREEDDQHEQLKARGAVHPALWRGKP
jgi:hypothetical protein